MKRLLIILLILPSCYSFGQSQQAEKAIQAGNDFYKLQQYDKAAAEYKNAIAIEPANSKAKFNLANTIVKQGKPDEAIKSFTEITGNTKETELKAKAFYNKGVVLSQQKKLEESIDAYKKSLRNKPDDADTKYNLAYAQKMIDQQQQQQNKKEDQKKEEQKKDDKKQDNKQEENKDQQQQKDKQQQQKQTQPKQYSKEELERIMQSLNADDKNVQEKVNKQKVQASGAEAEKDW